MEFSLSFLRGWNLFIREWGNGLIYPLGAYLAGMSCIFLWRTYRASPVAWRDEPGVALACAFVWFFLGESMRAGSAWLALNAQAEGRKLQPMTEDIASLVFALAAATLLAVFFRCIWIFAPQGKQIKEMAYAVLWTALVLAVANYLT